MKKSTRLFELICQVEMYSLDSVADYAATSGLALVRSRQGESFACTSDFCPFGIIALELLTAWDILNKGPSARGSPPSERRHRNWIHKSVLPRRDKAPLYKPLLNGLLSVNAKARWTASECQQWLARNERELQQENASYDESDRHTRSMHPTMSTSRAPSLPDTEPGGSGVAGKT